MVDPLQTIREWRAAGLVKVKRMPSGDILLRVLPQEPAGPNPVTVVFDHWRKLYSPRAVLDPKRRRVIVAALKRFNVEQLCRAITGYGNSPHHRGQNATSTKYLGIDLMLRDAAHIEVGIEWATKPSLKRVTSDPQAALPQETPEQVHAKWLAQMRELTGDSNWTPTNIKRLEA